MRRNPRTESRQGRLAPCLALAALLVVAPTTIAAQGLGLMNQSSDAPLEVDADDGIEWNQKKKIYVARGNVRATQEDVTLYTDRLTAHYREASGKSSQIWRINVDGRVRVESPNETAYGDNGVYDIDRGILLLTGRNLRLEMPDSRLTARDSLEYWEKQQLAVARGKAYAEQAQNRLWGDILSAYLYKDQRGKTAVQRIEAFGHVRVTTPQDVVVGDQGLYDVETRTAILCGAVKINRGGDLVTGKVAEVNLTTGRARIRPGRCTFTVK